MASGVNSVRLARLESTVENELMVSSKLRKINAENPAAEMVMDQDPRLANCWRM